MPSKTAKLLSKSKCPAKVLAKLHHFIRLLSKGSKSISLFINAYWNDKIDKVRENMKAIGSLKGFKGYVLIKKREERGD